MADQSTLQLLLEQAEAARDAALQALQQAEARAAQAHAQARELGDYQGQYDRRWQQQFQTEAASAQLLQLQRQFGQRLADAIDQQSTQAQLLDGRVQAARQQLQERELRVASVRKLIERRQAQQLVRELKTEQKLNDEFGARRRPSSL